MAHKDHVKGGEATSSTTRNVGSQTFHCLQESKISSSKDRRNCQDSQQLRGSGRSTWSVLWLSHTPGSDHAFLSWEIIPHGQWKNYRTFPPLCSPPFYPWAFKLWMVLKSQFTVQFGVHVLPRSIVDSSTLTHPHQQSGEKVLGSECWWHFQHFQHIPCPHRPAQNVVSRGQSHQRAQIPFNCRHPSLYPNQRWPQEG